MSYKDGFIIEYTGKHGVSCGNCIHFQSDKSCDKNGEYIPAIGYDYYKQCYHFQRPSDKECAGDRKNRIKREKREKKKAKAAKKALAKSSGTKTSTASSKSAKPASSAKNNKGAAESFEPHEGQAVYHPQYGRGRIIRDFGDYITVEFRNGNTKVFPGLEAFEPTSIHHNDQNPNSADTHFEKPEPNKSEKTSLPKKAAKQNRAKSQNPVKTRPRNATDWKSRTRTYVDSPEDPKDDEMPIKKTCSNCAYSRNSEHCSQFAVCDEWRFGKPSQSYWPTIEDERRRQLNDIRKRDR